MTFTLCAQEEQLRFATVDMQQLIRKHHLSSKFGRKMAEARLEMELVNKERIAAIKKTQEEVKRLRANADDPAAGKVARRDLRNRVARKSQEAAALERERIDLLARSKRRLQAQEAQGNSRIRKEIRRAVVLKAKELKVDYVFDVAGNAPLAPRNNPLPNLTAVLLEIINRDAGVVEQDAAVKEQR